MGVCFYIKDKSKILPEEKLKEVDNNRNPSVNGKIEENIDFKIKDFKKSSIMEPKVEPLKARPSIQYSNPIIFNNNSVLERYHSNVVAVSSKKVNNRTSIKMYQ